MFCCGSVSADLYIGMMFVTLELGYHICTWCYCLTVPSKAGLELSHELIVCILNYIIGNTRGAIALACFDPFAMFFLKRPRTVWIWNNRRICCDHWEMHRNLSINCWLWQHIQVMYTHRPYPNVRLTPNLRSPLSRYMKCTMDYLPR